MGSFSIWHWIIVLSIPALIIWLVVRISKKPPELSTPTAPSTVSIDNPYAPPLSHHTTIPALPLEASRPRPWVRYWARMLDIYLACIVGGIAIGIIYPGALSGKVSEQLFGIAAMFVWVFVESMLLSTIGTTPGKWLLKTKIVPPIGTQMNFSTALSRSFKVWWRGLGIGLPIASLITLILAHNSLTKNAIASWDRDDGLTVTHEKIGIIRTLVVIAFFVVFFFLIVVGSAAGT